MLKTLTDAILLDPDAPSGSSGGGSAPSGESSGTTTTAPASPENSGTPGGQVGRASDATAADPGPVGEDEIAAAMERVRADGDETTASTTDPKATVEGGDAGDEQPGNLVETPDPNAQPAQTSDALISDDLLRTLLAGAAARVASPENQTPAAPTAATQNAQDPAKAAGKDAGKGTDAPAAATAPPTLDLKRYESLILTVGEDEAKPLIEDLNAIKANQDAILAKLKAQEEAQAQQAQAAKVAKESENLHAYVAGITKVPGYDAKRFGTPDPTQPIRMGPNGPEGGGLTAQQWTDLKAVDLLATQLYTEGRHSGREITPDQAFAGAIRTLTRAKPPAAPALSEAQVVDKLRQQAATRSPAGLSSGNTRSSQPVYSDTDSPEDAIGKVMAKVRGRAPQR